MPKKKDFTTNIFKKAGIAGLVLTILVNPMTLARLTYNGQINNQSEKLALWFFDTILLVASVYLLLNWRRLTWRQIASAYTYLATTILTVTFLILLTIGLLFTGLKVANIYKDKTNPVSAKYNVDLTPLYPGMTKEQINQLLNETWFRPVAFEPYTQFKESAYNGQFVHVSKDGFRTVENQGDWPIDKQALNVFVFGGSTAFGYGVSDNQTIANYLQKELQVLIPDKNVKVYNFGRGVYFSTQERILFEKLIAEGNTPNIAIFIDGLNDFAKDGDPQFSDKIGNYFLLDQKSPVVSVPTYIGYQIAKSFSPLFQNLKTSNQPLDDPKYQDEARTKKIVARYLTNQKLIQAVSDNFGITPIFVWQPSPAYEYDLSFHLFAKDGFEDYNHTKYGYEFMRNNYQFSDNFLWLADIQKDLKEPLYVDKFHYTPSMNERIAQHISDFVIQNKFRL